MGAQDGNEDNMFQRYVVVSPSPRHLEQVFKMERLRRTNAVKDPLRLPLLQPMTDGGQIRRRVGDCSIFLANEAGDLVGSRQDGQGAFTRPADPALVQALHPVVEQSMIT